MKQIMLVGKFNTTTQNLKRIIGKEYQIQLASDDVEMVVGMLKMDVPDLVLISTTGMEKEHTKIFSHIRDEYPSLPVVYVGTQEELRLFGEFEESEQFLRIARPVQVKTILQAITQMLAGVKVFEEAEKKHSWDKKRIFIIDDSGVQRNMRQNLLQNKYETRAASSGMDALLMMKTWLPDLILLDYDMPDYDGKEVFEMFQKEKRISEIPVIFLTGVKQRQKIQAVLGLLPAGYLLKPVEQNKLLELLEEVLES